MRPAHGHWLISARMVRGHVRSDYWDGRNVGPTRDGAPGLLTFFGSKTFGSVRAMRGGT